MHGVPQKKFSLFWEHVTFHNLCLLQGIYVNHKTFQLFSEYIELDSKKTMLISLPIQKNFSTKLRFLNYPPISQSTKLQLGTQLPLMYVLPKLLYPPTYYLLRKTNFLHLLPNFFCWFSILSIIWKTGGNER